MLRVIDIVGSGVSDVADWIIWGIADDPCQTCSGPMCLSAPAGSGSQGVTHALVCILEKNVTLSTELPMASQHLVADRFALVHDRSSPNDANESIIASVRLLSGVLGANPGTPASTPPLSVTRTDSPVSLGSKTGVPIPDGYKSVSWMREYEAELVVAAYKNQTSYDLKNDDGNPIFQASYFADAAPEVLKFKANVEAARIRPANKRLVGWIRLEEARAVIAANREQRDVTFLHVRYGQGGLVQYYQEDSIEAKTYRSTTRLLRKR